MQLALVDVSLWGKAQLITFTDVVLAPGFRRKCSIYQNGSSVGFLACPVPLERRSERVRGEVHAHMCAHALAYAHLASEVKSRNRPKLASLVGTAVITMP